MIINLKPIQARIAAGEADADTMALMAEVKRLMRELSDMEAIARSSMSKRLAVTRAVERHREEATAVNILIEPAAADARLWAEVLGDA